MADNLPLSVQMHFPGELETFFASFIAIFQCVLSFEHFAKKISLIAQVFLKLLTPKDVIT